MKLALFDFDGTITGNDSLVDFIIYSQGELKAVFGFMLLSPVLLSYLIGWIPNFKAKQVVFSFFFRGWEEADFKSISRSFAQVRLPNGVKKEALDRIAWHKTRGDKVVVVSASLDCYLRPWCQTFHLDLISTEVEYKDNAVTGEFSTENCYGREKVERLKQRYQLKDFDYIYAYGDSKGDREMLQLADEAWLGQFP